MPWAKLDDQLHCHDKVDKAGHEAMGLWTLALTHSCARLAEGFVSKERVTIITRSARIGDRLAERLVKAGLWHAADAPCPEGHEECERLRRAQEGYRFHDWAEYQPDKETVERERARKRRNFDAYQKRVAAKEGGPPEPAVTAPQTGQKSISRRLAAGAKPVPSRGSVRGETMVPIPIPIPNQIPEEILPETVVPQLPREKRSGGPAATVTDRVSEELGRSPKTRKLATAEWASELVLVAGAVRADDLCAAIRKCVVGAPEGLTEAALKQRIVGFVANARNIEAVRRIRAPDVEEPAKKAHPPGYLPLGPRPDIPPPPMLFTGDPNEPIIDSPFPFLNAMGGKA